LINKPKTKHQLRKEIERQTQNFLGAGQQVAEIPKGVSSRDEAATPLRPEKWHMEKSSADRTYVPEVIEALDQRKQNKTAVKTTPKRVKKPRKRLIYDDFGEPLRWVWVDE
jgi:hypothetical protein